MDSPCHGSSKFTGQWFFPEWNPADVHAAFLAQNSRTFEEYKGTLGVAVGHQGLLICISTRQRQEYPAASELISHSTISLAIWLIRSHIMRCTNSVSDLVIASTLFSVFILSWNRGRLHDVTMAHFLTPSLFSSLVAIERKRFRILSPSCFLASLDGYSPNS